MGPRGLSTPWRFRLAYSLLAAAALAAGAGFLVAIAPPARTGAPGPPEIERSTCAGTPRRTKEFDRSRASLVLYSFIYDNVFRLDLHRGYRLATDKLRAAGKGPGAAPRTEAEWATGAIPVPAASMERGAACTVGARRTNGS